MNPRRYQVQWAPTAINDLYAILDFILDDRPTDAERIVGQIEAKAASLAHSPFRGRLVPELHRQGIAQYREIIHGPWRIIFTIHENVVRVMAVLDSRRNVQDLLFQRLLKR